VSDPQKPELNENDKIEQVLHDCGANTPEIERLSRIVNSMQHIEWQLARRAKRVSDPAAGAKPA
jgi:hypothetical protein